MVSDGYYIYQNNHFISYINVWLLCCTPETNNCFMSIVISTHDREKLNICNAEQDEALYFQPNILFYIRLQLLSLLLLMRATLSWCLTESEWGENKYGYTEGWGLFLKQYLVQILLMQEAFKGEKDINLYKGQYLSSHMHSI